MSKPSSPPKDLISLEIENPSSFQFSTVHEYPSYSTPVCGMGETGDDLPEGKGTESNILTAGEEWVVQSLTTLKGDIHPPFSEFECKSPDPVLDRSEPLFDKTP
ncbi:hypothetical protein R3W88_024260 [Solanum pinnatisectum]|uniref:Uncharacterized protein n=1 Tax=Solanum pinnatisectum TaxID=50273 RepID=A0AAV9M002_9SOLN|nr:hypothetical protein R3W88_024260 [Solanum pinnatisectum]